MKVVVLKDLPWDTSRGDVVETLRRMTKEETYKVIEDTRNHVLFLLNGFIGCILTVPGAGYIDADRRPPHLLLHVNEDVDPKEAQFSAAMQDEVRSIRNAAAWFCLKEDRISKIEMELGLVLKEENVI